MYNDIYFQGGVRLVPIGSEIFKLIAPWRDAEFIESFKGQTIKLDYFSKHEMPSQKLIILLARINFTLLMRVYSPTSSFLPAKIVASSRLSRMR